MADKPTTEAVADGVSVPPTDGTPCAARPISDPTPMVLMQRAIETGVDVGQLEKLMDLQERWEKNQAEKHFAEAMHLAQQETPSVWRDATNQKTRSRYAKLEGVQKAVKPVYSKHGFALQYGEADCPHEGLKRTVVDVRHVSGACHRYHLDLPIDGLGAKGNPSSMNAVQGAVSTTSYAQRRLLCMVFNIVLVDEDNDAQGPPIGETQAKELTELANKMQPEAMNRCLKWLGVETFYDVPAARYWEVKYQIERRINEGAD